MAKATMFAKAKQSEQPKKASADLKTVVPVNLGNKIEKLNSVREQIESLKAQESTLMDDIKPVAEEEYLRLFKKNLSRPDSFVLKSDKGCILVIIQDRYLKVTEEKEKVIREVYKKDADDLIEESTTYKFNEVLLQKYEKQISTALENLKGVPEEDKEALIVAETSKTIKKGTISKLFSFRAPETLFQLIRPVIQLKNQESE